MVSMVKEAKTRGQGVSLLSVLTAQPPEEGGSWA